MSGAADQGGRIERATAGAHRPAGVEPAIAYGPGAQDAVAEGGGDHALREHAAHEQGPAETGQLDLRPQADIREPFAQLMKKLGHGALMDGAVFGQGHGVASFADKEVTGEGEDVAGEVDEQNAGEPDLVVDEADHGAGDEPSALHSGQKEA